ADAAGSAVPQPSAIAAGQRRRLHAERRQAKVRPGADCSRYAWLGTALSEVANFAWPPTSDRVVPLHRVEVQPRLPLLLGLRQSSEGHDGRHCKAVNRLAA